MTSPQKYTLNKSERLKSRKAIEQLFGQGSSFSSFPFRVIWKFLEVGSPALQAGFSVGTRHFKNAVDRNRIKRQIREAYRLQKNELFVQLTNVQKGMIIFFIYTGNEIPEYRLVSDKMAAALSRLKKIVHENGVAGT